VGMVDVALHIEHGYAAGLRDIADIGVAHSPVDVADSDPVVVAPEDLPDLLACRRALSGRAALDELGVAPSWAMPASKEVRVLVLEKKNSMARTLSRR